MTPLRLGRPPVTMVELVIAVLCILMGAKGFDGGKGLWNACRACSSRSLNRWTNNVTADSQLALAA